MIKVQSLIVNAILGALRLRGAFQSNSIARWSMPLVSHLLGGTSLTPFSSSKHPDTWPIHASAVTSGQGEMQQEPSSLISNLLRILDENEEIREQEQTTPQIALGEVGIAEATQRLFESLRLDRVSQSHEGLVPIPLPRRSVYNGLFSGRIRPSLKIAGIREMHTGGTDSPLDRLHYNLAQAYILKLAAGLEAKVIEDSLHSGEPNQFNAYLNVIRRHIENSPDKSELGGEEVAPIMIAHEKRDSSLYIMHFNGTQSMHSHPGPRHLIVFTGDEPFYVRLGGRSDVINRENTIKNEVLNVVKVQFPPNSTTVLYIPEYVFHGFDGHAGVYSFHWTDRKNANDHGIEPSVIKDGKRSMQALTEEIPDEIINVVEPVISLKELVSMQASAAKSHGNGNGNDHNTGRS